MLNYSAVIHSHKTDFIPKKIGGYKSKLECEM